MRTLAVAAAICGSACAHVDLDRAMLASSTATIACDWGYTHRAAERGWENHHESNPLLGRTPSTAEVNAYFASMLVLNAAAWVLTPPKYRAVLPAVITAREIYSAVGNHEQVGGVCGF